MDGGGVFPITFEGGDFPIGAASIVVSDLLDELSGITALTAFFRFDKQVSAGLAVKAYLQTRLSSDDFTDIACAAFTDSGTAIFNLSGLTPKTTPIAVSDAALPDNSAIDGALGDALR